MGFDIETIREQFPILKQAVNGKPLVYLDNAATSQKPKCVIDAIANYYATLNANVHRGIHTLSQKATLKMEQAREKVQQFIGAEKANEIIFSRGTTESINMVAAGLTHLFSKGDQILISALEHHSNIVPWQMLCERTGAVLKVIPLDNQNKPDIGKIKALCNKKTKMVALSHISNALGVIIPVKQIIDYAKSVGAYTLIDGAQAVAHTSVNVQLLGCDFYTFSAHKMYGPTGIGILYGKQEALEQLSPWQGGGEMIKQVTFEKTTYAELPFRLEGGTPHIEGVIVLGTAIDWIKKIGMEKIRDHENQLLDYATKQLSQIKTLQIYAKQAPRAGAVSFNLNIAGVHSSDVGSILDKLGIAVRTGHHCAQPLMQKLNVPGTVRASFALYNTFDEIDLLVEATKTAEKMLS